MKSTKSETESLIMNKNNDYKTLKDDDTYSSIYFSLTTYKVCKTAFLPMTLQLILLQYPLDIVELLELSSIMLLLPPNIDDPELVLILLLPPPAIKDPSESNIVLLYPPVIAAEPE